MYPNTDLLHRFNLAKKDPVVVVLRWSMWLVGVLFFGRVEVWLWGALCELQNRRYRALVPLD